MLTNLTRKDLIIVERALGLAMDHEQDVITIADHGFRTNDAERRTMKSAARRLGVYKRIQQKVQREIDPI